MSQYRKKPVVIEATQWFKHGDHSAVVVPSGVINQSEFGLVRTLEGWHVVTPGDWIITGVKGEHYPCKPDIFAATYEPASQAAPVDALPEPINPHWDYLARYWRLGFDGKPMVSCTGDKPMKAWADGKKAREDHARAAQALVCATTRVEAKPLTPRCPTCGGQPGDCRSIVLKNAAQPCPFPDAPSRTIWEMLGTQPEADKGVQHG
jgi:hypothetical protein